MKIAYGLIFAIALSACKTTKNKSGDDPRSDNVGGPMMESGNSTPPDMMKPAEMNPATNMPGTNMPATGMTNPPAEMPQVPTMPMPPNLAALPEPAAPMMPQLPTAPPALKNPGGLTKFYIRSIPIELNLDVKQYMVDLDNHQAATFSFSNDQWTETSRVFLVEGQMKEIRAQLTGLKVGKNPTCNPCKREVHTIVLEGQEEGKKALAFAVNEGCTCGGNDERKAAVAFNNLKAIMDLLDKK